VKKTLANPEPSTHGPSLQFETSTTDGRFRGRSGHQYTRSDSRQRREWPQPDSGGQKFAV